MKQFIPISVLLALLIVSSCAVRNSKFFSKITESDESTYGYTPENPIMIRNHTLDKSIGSSNYYINCLRNSDGKKLQLVDQKIIVNPKYDSSLEYMDSHYTGEALSYGNGPTLDLYRLINEGQSDTINIYINTYVESEVKVPKGLKFKKESME